METTEYAMSRRASSSSVMSITTDPDDENAQSLDCCVEISQHKDWATDHAAILMSIAIVCIMGAVLQRYNGTAYDDWPLPITLNATVSLLVTVLYTFLLMPVSSCLGQLKWNIFSSGCKLSRFEQFEEAGRSIFGAVALLCSRSVNLNGTFAALLFVLITGIGPFSQQIISVQNAMQDSYPLRGSQDPYMATVPVLEVDSVNNAIQSTVYTGLFSYLDTNFTITPDNCRGVNCSWPTYTSLHVRHQCHDITVHLNTSLKVSGTPNGTSWVNMTLPNAHKLNLTVPAPPFHQPFFPGATNVSSDFPPLTFPGQGNVLLYTSIIHIPRIDWGLNRSRTVSEAVQQATAVECMLQTVARPYTATSIDGVFNEDPAGPDITNNSDYAICTSPWQVWYNESSLAGPEVLAAADAVQSLPREDIIYDVPPQYLSAGYDIEGNQAVKYHFSSNPKGMAVLSIFLTSLFQGSTDSLNFARCEPGQVNLKTVTDFAWGCGIQPTAFSTIATLLSNLATWPFGAHTESENPALPIIEAVFENVATSLTTAMRQSGVNTTIALGTRQVSTITYAVDWRWMCVPTALCALVLVLLLLVINDTKRRRIKVWKGNPVAVSVHGMDAKTKYNLMGEDLHTLRKFAARGFGKLDSYRDEIVVEPGDDVDECDLEGRNRLTALWRLFSARW